VRNTFFLGNVCPNWNGMACIGRSFCASHKIRKWGDNIKPSVFMRRNREFELMSNSYRIIRSGRPEQEFPNYSLLFERCGTSRAGSRSLLAGWDGKQSFDLYN
jgi:hypothetical protein